MPGGDDAHHFAFDRLVAGSPICSQMAAAPSSPAARGIALHVIRHSRHFDRRPVGRAALGQGDVEQPGGAFRIGMEEFVRNRPCGRTAACSGCCALMRRYCCIIGVCFSGVALGWLAVSVIGVAVLPVRMFAK